MKKIQSSPSPRFMDQFQQHYKQTNMGASRPEHMDEPMDVDPNGRQKLPKKANPLHEPMEVDTNGRKDFPKKANPLHEPMEVEQEGGKTFQKKQIPSTKNLTQKGHLLLP